MKNNRQTMAWRLAAGMLAVALAWGCGRSGDEMPATPMGEGMAAEALGDRGTALAKYEEARQGGNREGSRKVAELTMREFEEELFPAEPKDEAWVSAARESYSRLETAGLEAEEAGFPVEGLAAALETYKESIEAAAEVVRKNAAMREAGEQLAVLKSEQLQLEEDIRNEQRKLDTIEEEAATALGAILAEFESQAEEMAGRALALALQGQDIASYSSWAEMQQKRGEEATARHEALMDPLRNSLKSKRERLEAVKTEIKACERRMEGDEGGLTSPQEPPIPRKLTDEEREALWEGW